VVIAGAIVWLGGLAVLPLGIGLPHPLDYAAHAAGFALFALSLELAWRENRHGTPIYRRHLILFGLLALFGAADEIHQAFVPGRGGDPVDWLADLAGTVLGLAAGSLPVVLTRLSGMGWQRGTARRSDPAAPLILVADPHWSGELTGLLEARAAHPGADWLFLGDVFDVWVGLPGMDGPQEKAFLAWVEATRREGRWVGLWLGNREYFLDSLSRRFDLMGEGTGGQLAGEGLAWEHEPGVPQRPGMADGPAPAQGLRQGPGRAPPAGPAHHQPKLQAGLPPGGVPRGRGGTSQRNLHHRSFPHLRGRKQRRRLALGP
jgi:hypothetical protein